MIYLYAGLGMAMLLPILVGLQSAVYVAELEQGELAMQNSSRIIAMEWESNRTKKKVFRDNQLNDFPQTFATGVNCNANAPARFSKPVINECAYHSEATLDDLYIARIYQKNGVLRACLAPASGLTQKCPEEYELP